MGEAGEGPRLEIPAIGLDQAGHYRCEVEYKLGKRTERRTELRVRHDPRPPAILRQPGGRAVERAVRAEPGERVSLVCRGQGGWPEPELFWYRDHQLQRTQGATFQLPGRSASPDFQLVKWKLLH